VEQHVAASSRCRHGLEVKLEFRFESDADADVFAGFYIDDGVVEVGAP
jgi:hypothetical protein